MAHPTNMAVIFVSSGVFVDAGGFWIDAEGHIHRIPPWNPDTLAQITVGATMLNNAKHIHDRTLSRHIEIVAEEVISDAIPSIEEHLGAGVH